MKKSEEKLLNWGSNDNSPRANNTVMLGRLRSEPRLPKAMIRRDTIKEMTHGLPSGFTFDEKKAVK
jgi:hypothetical protein